MNNLARDPRCATSSIDQPTIAANNGVLCAQQGQSHEGSIEKAILDMLEAMLRELYPRDRKLFREQRIDIGQRYVRIYSCRRGQADWPC